MIVVSFVFQRLTDVSHHSKTIMQAMKLDPDIPIVQNEAAIMTTMAAELFLKKLALESHRIAKQRGRNTIR